MKKTTEDFLNLLFDPGETICVSDCDGGYHSVPQDLDSVVLVSPKEEKLPRTIPEERVILTAINPINGFRRDECVTSFRTFLVEMDDGNLADQKEYIEKMGMPYSICIFSGNKSLHYGIVLSEDMVNINVWRTVNQWILNILKRADQQVKNPSRSIRFPGNKRPGGKLQSLVEIKGRISQEELYSWLNQFPESKPEPPKPYTGRKFKGIPSFRNVPDWVKETLNEGITTERNKNWFKIGCVFAERNFDLEETVEILDSYFYEDIDFDRNEWLMCIKSAFKRINGS